MGYLVTGRRIGERISIGKDIEILISDINMDLKKVDIAIKAPRELTIKRLPCHIEEHTNEFRHKNRSRNCKTD